ncbi:SDR family oxidoreductase [Paracidovorax wautersii]|uniref:Short-subunit dehydrogenase n=1 Tax=Paracidovorax wautersii TaxID=1177982 RepID=A0ABU1IFR2_9BURK|nr:SDR family oxidoreductase [Paracidovorax wautersii]MDR6215423.1 short-subunit dehydrogenase [Paracidovorax wautersii]
MSASSSAAFASPRGTALVTGASSGIGATYADRLARRGYDLILVARDAERLAAVAGSLQRAYGVHAEVLQADLTDRAALARVEERLRTDTRIALLVNNAGMSVNGTLAEADIDAVERMIQLNVTAPTRLAAAAAKAFAARKAGTLINIASVLALAPELFSGSYSGTKAYVLNLSHSLAREMQPHGVRVQAVLPGATRTEIWERSGASADGLPPEMVMDVDPMVDAALAGLDLGEAVTIPPLEALDGFLALEQARQQLAPHLSRNRPATRYAAGATA